MAISISLAKLYHLAPFHMSAFADGDHHVVAGVGCFIFCDQGSQFLWVKGNL